MNPEIRTCITCQTNPINPMIGKSFCSQLCKSLYLRTDLEFVTMEALKRIALKQHEYLKKYIRGLNKELDKWQNECDKNMMDSVMEDKTK